MPRGLDVLTWRYSLIVGGGQVTSGALVITNVRVVSGVRMLVNSLPVTVTDPQRNRPLYVTWFSRVFYSARFGAVAQTRVA